MREGRQLLSAYTEFPNLKVPFNSGCQELSSAQNMSAATFHHPPSFCPRRGEENLLE